MDLSEIVKTVGCPHEALGDSFRFTRDFAFLDLSDSYLAYQSSKPLKSRHYFNYLVQNFPLNRFIAGFHEGFQDYALTDLQKMERENTDIRLRLEYSSEEADAVTECIKEYLMASIP